VPTLAAVTLIGGVAAAVSSLPPLTVLAVVAGLAAAAPAIRLVRLALAIHASQRSFGPCRGAGFLGVGVSVAGLTAAVLPLAGTEYRAVVAAAGLVPAASAFVLGLLLLPGAAPTVSARLRRAFDGVSVGVSLAFGTWLTLPHEAVSPAVFLAALVAILSLSIIGLAAVRAARYRPASLLCGGGAAVEIIGLTTAAAVVADAGPERMLLVAAGLLVLGPVLVWAGARRSSVTPVAAGPLDARGTLAGYPVLTLPAGAAIAAVVWHLLTVGFLFDRPAVVLGVGVAAAMAAREVIAAADLRHFARQLTDQEAHFRSLVSGSSDVTMVLDADLAVRWQSPAAARQFGLSDQDVLGRPFTELVHPDDAPAVETSLRGVVTAHADAGGAVHPVLVEARLRDGFGQWRDTESTVSDQRSTPEVGALVVHVRDVGERKQLERTLHRLAFTDQLTGLPNRRELLRTLATVRSVPGRNGALLVVDLHGTASINDVLGREVGDAVLIEVARRLRTGANPEDLPARLGGDEFAVLTADPPVQAYALGTRLLTTLTEPYQLPGATVNLSATVGLTELAAGSGVDDVLNRADLARRRARQLGCNRIEWYDESLEALLQRRMDIERDLPAAAVRNELDLVYQPVVELADRSPAGLEALLRWRHPTLGTILPGEFVPIADDLGVVAEIGDWVLRAACRQLSLWLHEGRDMWVAVNVSLRQLALPSFVATVASAIDTYHLPPDRLVIEITESAVGADLPTVVTQLAGLRALGVRTALDHFGVGPTSLAYLRRLPVDVLKIDSALFAEPAGPSVPIVDVVVSLGRRLGLEVVAEGLEVEGHLDLVRNAGCRYGQGFLFGRPAPVEHVEAYLESLRP
jgi:diguanylate cyclase (GGDEF)-like protein/PAS domain S-box-containing protein